jgi:hypothetical protein
MSSRRIAVPQQVTRTVYTNVPEQHTVKEAYTSYRAKEVQTFKTEVVHDSKTIQVPRQVFETITQQVQVPAVGYVDKVIMVPKTTMVPNTVRVPVRTHAVLDAITHQVQVPSVGYVDKVIMVPQTIMVPHTVREPVRTHEVKEVQVNVPKIVHDERTVQVPRAIQVPQTVTVQEPVIEYRDRVVTVNKAVPQLVTHTVMRKAKIPVYVQKHYSYHEGPAVSYGSGYISGHNLAYASIGAAGSIVASQQRDNAGGSGTEV